MEGLQLRCSLAETTALTVPAPLGGVTAGRMDQFNGLVGVFASDAEEGSAVAFLIRAARMMAPRKVSDGAMAPGEKVYLDLVDRKLTSASEDTILCGVVAADTEADAEWVEVVLDGVLGVLG